MGAVVVLGEIWEIVISRAELESYGLRILDRNWRCAAGEIDIVAAAVVSRQPHPTG
jgi:Holliday junction resolvase-like predicted endonuclease